jgi:phospho-N-acetylmuramoyl-pentapeptide-transferase
MVHIMHYVSFRAIAGLLTSFFSSVIIGGIFIKRFKRLLACRVREYVPETHTAKNNKPTMGGLFILLVVTCNALLWCDLTCANVWVLLFCLAGFGALGAWDDWSKINHTRGIKSYKKFIAQCCIASITIFLWLWIAGGSTCITVPFFKHCLPDIGLFFIPWAVFVMVALSNAVNLTDGLDGLAIGSLIPNFIIFSLMCYLAGHTELSSYLLIPHAQTAEIAVMGALLIGASLGFLWYNAYPAEIFMGDVGSLSLGAGLACMALMAKQELLLPVAGALFVLEVVSVILQVFSVKLRGKRLFLMAPIHHHFELLGWKETTITIRFSIISLVMCLLALITFKLR